MIAERISNWECPAAAPLRPLPWYPVRPRDEDAAAARLRRAILRLADSLAAASESRPDIAPILSDAMNNAIERLLVHDDEQTLLLLKHWLDAGREAPT